MLSGGIGEPLVFVQQFRQTNNYVCEFQAEARERERQKEETRKSRKLESAFRSLLRDTGVDYHSAWEDVREKLTDHDAFRAIGIESERLRIFKVQFLLLHLFHKTNKLIQKLINMLKTGFLIPVNSTTFI